MHRFASLHALVVKPCPATHIRGTTMRARITPKKRTKPAVARTKVPAPRPSNPGLHRGEDVGRFGESESKPRRGEAC